MSKNSQLSGRIEETGDVPINAVLRKFGGWPVVVGNQWQNSGWRLETVLGTLRRVYNAPLIIDTWVSADDKDSNSNILQVDGTGHGTVHGMVSIMVRGMATCLVMQS